MKILLNQLNSNQYITELYRKEALNCIRNPESTERIKDSFLKLEALCNSTNQHASFCTNAQKLAAHLQKTGKIKLANLLYGELGKIYVGLGKTALAEETIEKSIEICACMEDKLHILARLTDLEMIFKQVRDGKKLYQTLIRKIECAKEILNNYEYYAGNFSTISKKPLKEEGVKVQMAFAYSDLADIIKHKRPSHSIKLLENAKSIYSSLGKQNEVRYLERKIEYLRQK